MESGESAQGKAQRYLLLLKVEVVNCEEPGRPSTASRSQPAAAAPSEPISSSIGKCCDLSMPLLLHPHAGVPIVLKAQPASLSLWYLCSPQMAFKTILILISPTPFI